MKNCFELAGQGLKCEALWKAVLCGGAVYPWRHEYVRVRRGPGCWGYEIRLDAGGYVMERGGPVYLEQGFRRVMDDPGDVLEYIAVSPGGGLGLRALHSSGGGRRDSLAGSWSRSCPGTRRTEGVCVRACRRLRLWSSRRGPGDARRARGAGAGLADGGLPQACHLRGGEGGLPGLLCVAGPGEA